MADQTLNLLKADDDCLDDSDEGVYEQGDGPSGGEIEDESLTPLQQIRKYALSDVFCRRQSVPQHLLKIFKLAQPDELTTDLPVIMDVFSKLADDEPVVRSDVLEQIPHLATLALECSPRVPGLANITSEYLLSMVVRNLGNPDNVVRKVAQRSLFSLLEQGLVTKAQAEIQVCPTILALSRKEYLKEYLMHCHSDSVTLMSKLVPLLGRDVTERVFLDRFAELCSNPLFYVRKVCASHFGDFCAVISRPCFERVLFPAYIKLCNDDVWGVRKACADVAMTVSCTCSPELRRTQLAPAFAQLLQDKIRWVRISAFETLGPFISTFADPTVTSLTYNSQGELVLVNSYGSEFKISSPGTPLDEVKHLIYLSLDDLLEQNSSDPHFQESGGGAYPDDGAEIKCNDEEDEEREPLPPLPIEDVGDHAYEHHEDHNAKHEPTKGEEEHSVPDDDDDNIKELNIDTETAEKVLDSKEISGESMLEEDRSPVVAPPVSEDDDDDDEDEEEESRKHKGYRDVVSFVNETGFNMHGFDIENLSVSDLLGPGFLDDLVEFDYSTMEVKEGKKIDNRVSVNENVTAISRDDCGGCTKVDEIGNNEDNLELYNSYNYWYVPPVMPLDPNIVAGIVVPDHDDKQETDRIADKVNDNVFKTANKALNDCTLNTTYTCQDPPKESIQGPKPIDTEGVDPPQTIVPQLLIDHFISMANPEYAQNNEDNIAYHCAYSLPAVALTLGSSNSHLLKNTVDVLAANMQYKVRHTLASSLHELALIWGPDVASCNLAPIFNEFIKDLDEVRIGILKHLAHFLRLLSPNKRSQFLPKFAFFLEDNRSLNWRYRYELAEQLLLSVNMFTPAEASKHIAHIAQKLLNDKVAAVRQIALQLVAELLRHISGEPGLTPRLLIKFAETFAHSKKWKLRQTFVLLSAELLVSKALPIEQFASEVMPHLLDLSWDPVANVRLVVGRTIANYMITNEYFQDPENQDYDSLLTVLRRLQIDKDVDVRQSALTENTCKNLY